MAEKRKGLRDLIADARERIAFKVSHTNPSSKEGVANQTKAEAFDELCEFIDNEAAATKPKPKAEKAEA